MTVRQKTYSSHDLEGGQILITCLCGLTDCLHVDNELTVPIKILESGFVWDLCVSGTLHKSANGA